MYVCVCNAVTDRQIRQAIDAGARSMRDLRQQLGVCSDCGKCGPCARELLTEAKRPAEPAFAVPGLLTPQLA
jgi:bacterioferritin-associated ferredoxin